MLTLVQHIFIFSNSSSDEDMSGGAEPAPKASKAFLVINELVCMAVCARTYVYASMSMCRDWYWGM